MRSPEIRAGAAGWFGARLLVKLFNCLLLDWWDSLSSRTRAEPVAVKNKMVLATSQPSSTYLRPLSRQLKSGIMPEDVCTLNLSLQDRMSRLKRDISTIIHILGRGRRRRRRWQRGAPYVIMLVGYLLSAGAGGRRRARGNS